MYKTLLSVFSLLFGAAILFAGHGIQAIALPLKAEALGFSEFITGSLWSTYAVGMLLGCYLFPRLIATIGHVRAFAVASAMTTISVLLYSLFTDPWVWLLVRFIYGFVMTGFFMVTESWLNERTPNAVRGRVLATYSAITLLMMSVGQVLINYVDPLEGTLLLVAALLLCFAQIPLTLSQTKAPVVPEGTQLDVRKLWSTTRLSFVGSLIAGMLISMFWALGPVYGIRSGFGTELTSLHMGAVVAGGVCLQWPLGRLSDLIDRRAMILILGLANVGASFGLALFGTQGTLSLVGFSFLFGGLIYAMNAIIMAFAFDRSDEMDLVKISSGLLFLFGVGSAFGPLIGASMMAEFGPSALYQFAACLSFIMVIVAVLLIATRKPVPEDDRDDFALSARTTPEIYRRDPRGDEHPRPD